MYLSRDGSKVVSSIPQGAEPGEYNEISDEAARQVIVQMDQELAARPSASAPARRARAQEVYDELLDAGLRHVADAMARLVDGTWDGGA